MTDTDLAGAATDALDDEFEPGPNGELPGMHFSRVKFKGMAWETLELPELREEVTFTVKGMITGHGEELMSDGEIRQVATVKVLSVYKDDDA